LRISDFADLDHPSSRLMTYVSDRNVQAHSFNWSTVPEAKVMAKCEAQAIRAPAACLPIIFRLMRTLCDVWIKLWRGRTSAAEQRMNPYPT